MTNYTVTFSNGETVTRTSDHKYTIAWRAFVKSTGETKQSGFSAKPVTQTISVMFQIDSWLTKKQKIAQKMRQNNLYGFEVITITQ